ncbi:hypothetical protein [Lutimonas sp.]|uniref:hypothetical protein n=1 Tax=Lutimonas sp. TaxID=1872403 RepID=UPI003D9B408D
MGKSILGNWYFYAVDSTKSDPYYFYYTEVFIKKDTIFASSESAGLISPMEFKIYGDSVSYNIQNDYNWKAKIESISQESFSLKILYGDGIKIEKYYKLTDKPNLEDFRNGRVSESEFYNKFWKRMMSLEKSFGL